MEAAETDHVKWDTIVVGSGLGGLSTAAHLAAAGQRVLVCEQYDVAGGCSQVFRRKRQWQFDVGLHYVGGVHSGDIGAVLGGLGLLDRIEWLEMDPDGFDTLVFPRHTVRVPRGWERYEERIVAALGVEEEDSVRRCIGVLRSVAHDLRSVPMPKSKLDYVRYPLRARNVVVWGMRPVAALFEHFGLSDAARAIIFAQSGDYATPPSRSPVALHAGLLDHYLHEGAYYVLGGGQTVAAHLVDVIHTHGGRVRTRARVDHIAVEGGRVVGVRLETGEEIRAARVVSTADIKQTFLRLLDEQSIAPRFHQRVREFRMATPLFCVYLGLDRDLRETMPNTNYWIHPDYDPEHAYTLAAHGRLATNPPTFITSASVKDPFSADHAPDGCSTLELMTWATPDCTAWGVRDADAQRGRYRKDQSYRAVKGQLTERLIDVAEGVIGDVRGHISWKEAATPLTQARYTLASDGSSYGIELAVDQTGPRRPAPQTPIGGLFLAGASARSGHGIVGALVGGREAASAILGRDLQEEARRGAVFADVDRLTAGGPGFDPLEACRRLQDKQARKRVPA
jgi:phytoene dehydrogenase-like protein